MNTFQIDFPVAAKTADELIQKLNSYSGGWMFLDDFCSLVPLVSKADCVAALKNNPLVLVNTGRYERQTKVFFGIHKYFEGQLGRTLTEDDVDYLKGFLKRLLVL